MPQPSRKRETRQSKLTKGLAELQRELRTKDHMEAMAGLVDETDSLEQLAAETPSLPELWKELKSRVS
jgi:hypothetical protein